MRHYLDNFHISLVGIFQIREVIAELVLQTDFPVVV